MKPQRTPQSTKQTNKQQPFLNKIFHLESLSLSFWAGSLKKVKHSLNSSSQQDCKILWWKIRYFGECIDLCRWKGILIVWRVNMFSHPPAANWLQDALVTQNSPCVSASFNTWCGEESFSHWRKFKSQTISLSKSSSGGKGQFWELH